MECPRCDGSLKTYSLGGRTAVVCERCGYVGVDVNHHTEPVEVESWAEAIRRFHEEE